MWKTICTGISGIVLLIAINSCASISLNSAYNRFIFDGKEQFGYEEYGKARENFQKAAELRRDAVALTYLAITYYKTNNLGEAERLILEAEKLDINNYVHLRTLGYKALILLKKDRSEGMRALREYLDYYWRSDPLMTIDNVERMWHSGNIDIPELEDLIEEQVSWWENDVEQLYQSGTGFYDRSPWPGGFFR
jgi:tetratricopeptide (TPR) repeat protein